MTATIRVEHRDGKFRLRAFSLPECGENQGAFHVRVELPFEDLSGVKIHDYGEVIGFLPGEDVSDIACPDLSCGGGSWQFFEMALN